MGKRLGGPTRRELVERASQGIGAELFKKAQNHSPHAFSSPIQYAEGLLLEQLIADPRLKRYLIGLVSAQSTVPYEEYADFFRKYFTPKRNAEIGGWIGEALSLATALPFDHLIADVIAGSTSLMSQRFLAGQNISESVKTVVDLHQKGLFSTLDVVTEEVTSTEQAEHYGHQVDLLMNHWAEIFKNYFPTESPLTPGSVPVLHISIKPSAQTHRLDPLATDWVVEDAGKRLFQRFLHAKNLKLPLLINADMEHRYRRTLSNQIVWKAATQHELQGWDNFGIVVQAYLRDSLEILKEHIHQAEQTGKRPQIRIVKGAYHQFEQKMAEKRGWEISVFLEQEETDRNFLENVRLALLHRESLRIAVGTHNIGDMASVMTLMQELGASKNEVEFQFLKGVGDHLALSVKEMGYPARVYCPFGPERDALPYMVRRLDEVNPTSAIGQSRISGTSEDYFLSILNRIDASKNKKPIQKQTQKIFSHCPETDWSREEERKNILRARELRQKKGPLHVVPLLATGDVAFDKAKAKPTQNPAHLLEIIGLVIDATETDVAQALALAKSQKHLWSDLARDTRSEIFEKWAEALWEKRFELADLISAEISKTADLAMGDVREAIDAIRYYAEQSLELPSDWVARGVGVDIAPFNFFAIGIAQAAAMLASGNVVLFKPADQTPVSSFRGVQLGFDAGLPRIALQFLPGGPRVGEQLTASKTVKMVSFTGSEATSRKIFEKPEKLIVAETGGNNALLIDHSANLDLAVEAVMTGLLGVTGQRCSKPARLIVEERIADDVAHRLVESFRSVIIGDPGDLKTQMGALIDARAREKFLTAMERGKKEGVLLYPSEKDGGSEGPFGGYFVKPHLFDHVPQNANLVQQEVFGPVISIIRFKNINEAIEIANGVPQGLTAGIFSQDPEHVKLCLDQIEAGNIYVNRPIVEALIGSQPFGGSKASGTGPKAGGQDTVEHYGESSLPRYEGKILDPVGESQKFLEDKDLSLPKKLILSAPDRIGLVQKLLKKLNGAKDPEIVHAHTLIEKYLAEAQKILFPQPTIERPDDINLQVYDWSLGVGLIWTEGEALSHVLSAVAASLLGNNLSILPKSHTSDFVEKLISDLDWPKEAITIVRCDPTKILQKSWVDFSVCYGKLSKEVYEKTVTAPLHNGFRRMIGRYERPEDPNHLKRFVNARVWTIRRILYATDVGGVILTD